MTDHLYDTTFYEDETRVAAESAAIVIPYLIDHYDPVSVIDVGSGTGAWAAEAAKHGCDTLAVDHGVPTDLIVAPDYRTWDLTNGGYSCGGYDLAICLEVAEHLPEEVGPTLVKGLAEADLVLFSAATPGQPGVGHINCREHDYWHGLFASWGMQPIHIGARFTEPVADFYRRNAYLYSRDSK